MMKKVFVLISFVVTILVIGGNAFAQDKTPKSSIPDPPLGPEWKLINRDSDGTTYYFNTKKITYLHKGVVKVWTLWVPRGEERRRDINVLKRDLLSRGEDPNDAERRWYTIFMYKVNCKNNEMATLEAYVYSFEQTVLIHESAPYEKWFDIVPGSVGEKIENYVCK